MAKSQWLQANAHKFNFTHVKSRVKNKWITHNFKLSTVVHPWKTVSECEIPIEAKKYTLAILNNSVSLVIYTENKQMH